MISVFDWVDNLVDKEENVDYKHFLSFSQSWIYTVCYVTALQQKGNLESAVIFALLQDKNVHEFQRPVSSLCSMPSFRP